MARGAVPLVLVVSPLLAAACATEIDPLTAERVVPSQGPADAATDVAIEGRAFQRRTTVDAVSGEVAIEEQFGAWLDQTPLEGVVWRSAVRIDARVPPGLEPGFHDLRLSDAFGRQASLTRAFAVLAPDGSAGAGGGSGSGSAGGSAGAGGTGGSGGAGGGSGPISVDPVVDGWLRQQFPTEVHFKDVDLRSGSGSTTNRANRTVLRFDVSGFAPACVIASAQLRLSYFADGQSSWSGVSPTLEAHRMTAAWTEQATWLQRDTGVPWTTQGGDFEPAASTIVQGGSYGWFTWDITPLAKQWCQDKTGNFGLILLEPDDALGNMGRKLFHASELSDGRLRPALEITIQ